MTVLAPDPTRSQKSASGREAAAEYRARVRFVELSAEADCQQQVSDAIEAATNRAITMANEERRDEEERIVWLGHGEIQRRTRRTGT